MIGHVEPRRVGQRGVKRCGIDNVGQGLPVGDYGEDAVCDGETAGKMSSPSLR